MDVLWSPWRYDYITASDAAKISGCVFCDILNNSATDEENFILRRAEFNFVILNIKFVVPKRLGLKYDGITDHSHHRRTFPSRVMNC